MRAAMLYLLAATTIGIATGRADEPKPKADPKPVEPKAADADAPLPEGWPAATKPGAIEVKNYPAYRSAVARAKDSGAMKADGGLFFALFGHIQTRGVAMTAPVVCTFETRVLDDPKATGAASMEFLYRHPDQGEAGPGLGRVTVEDHPAATYVSLGVQGGMGPDTLRASVGKLREWLDAHKAEWVAAGEPRWLGYHAPSTPEAERLYEVQIPVKPATRPGN